MKWQWEGILSFVGLCFSSATTRRDNLTYVIFLGFSLPNNFFSTMKIQIQIVFEISTLKIEIKKNEIFILFLSGIFSYF